MLFMEQDLKIHHPEEKTVASEHDFHGSAKSIIQRHLTDINDTISDEDIRNVKTDFEQDEDSNES